MHWPEVLRQQIEKFAALILLLPWRDASNRNYLWFEAGAAKALGKPILVAMPPEHRDARTDVPVDLADLIVLNADETAMDRLAYTHIRAVPDNGAPKVSDD